MQLKGDVSINQFIVNALVEKISALRTETYLQERASRGSRQHAYLFWIKCRMCSRKIMTVFT